MLPSQGIPCCCRFVATILFCAMAWRNAATLALTNPPTVPGSLCRQKQRGMSNTRSNGRPPFFVMSPSSKQHDETNHPDDDEAQDTIRVRIWRVLTCEPRQEWTLPQLGAKVGERILGQLKAHLQHVEKQAKTLANKNDKWKERRGLDTAKDKQTTINKLRLQTRRGAKNQLLVRLE